MKIMKKIDNQTLQSEQIRIRDPEKYLTTGNNDIF